MRPGASSFSNWTQNGALTSRSSCDDTANAVRKRELQRALSSSLMRIEDKNCLARAERVTPASRFSPSFIVSASKAQSTFA